MLDLLKKYGSVIIAAALIVVAFKYNAHLKQPQSSVGIESKDITDLQDQNIGQLSPENPVNGQPQFPVLYQSHGKFTANVIHTEKTLYGDIVIFDWQQHARCFLIEGVNESCWHFKKQSPSGYVRNEKLLLEHMAQQSEVEDILVIGVGAGMLLKDMDMKDVKVDGVDINPSMKDVADKFFGLPKDLDFEYIIDDGRHYLNTTDKKYDAIILDLCYINEYNAHLWTKEFYALAKDHLKDPETGFIISSRAIVTGEKSDRLDNMIAGAMKESFSYLHQVERKGTREGQFDMGVYIASNKEYDFSNLERPLVFDWEYSGAGPIATDELNEELVRMFLPAADSIREQTFENVGREVFLPL